MQLSKILIFGGTFDPFHNGHYEILNQAEQLIKPDKVLIVPNHINPIKEIKSFTSDVDRVKMIELAIQDKDNWEISNFEINKKEPSYTIDTINHFLEIYPNSELYLLIGLDQWNNFKSWKNYSDIIAKCKIVIAKRDGQEINNILNANILTLPGVSINISSTQIRLKPFPYSLNYNVLNFINDNGLYAIERIKPLLSQKRFEHCLRVGYMAKELMSKYDPSQAHLAYSAGIYHDIAKEMNFDKQSDIAENTLGIINYASVKLLHGYIGAHILRTNYLFNNQLILDAISRHTKIFDYYTTKPTLLDKVIYLADKLEPNRTDEDVFGQNINEYRQLAYENIDECFEKLYRWLQINLSKK